MWNTFGPLWTARDGAELRLPPAARGMVEILRRRGHVVTVREMRCGSLRYSVDGSRERTALATGNKYRTD